MLTAIVYNCNPESLADVDQAAFVDAFENEIRVKPNFRELSIRVTFDAGKSGLTSISADDADWPDPLKYNDEFCYLAEKAFRACCV